MEKELRELYEKWSDEIVSKCSALLGKEYSNPYYVSIPENWENSPQRIMIVGEEGYGEWGCGKKYGQTPQDPPYTIKSIEQLQEYNSWVIKTKKSSSKLTPFWRRFNKILDLGFPCIWNNLDKIHSTIKRSKLKYKLSNGEEQLLHITPTKILQKEIEILKPTIVIFFGWYSIALRAELPKVFELFDKDRKSHKDKNIHKVELDKITYIFTNHPRWGITKKGYEEEVLNLVTSATQE